MNTSILMPTPVRAKVSDVPAEILSFAVESYQDCGVALATLIEIRGGAARALGSQMAIASDGRFCGYVSGGCVEAAVASEALLAFSEGRDRTVMFGKGSDFFDIVLPCGGGITVAIHLLKEVAAIRDVIKRLEERQPAALLYDRGLQELALVDSAERSGWVGENFVILYHPRSRVVISGGSLEADAVANLANASGYDIVLAEDRVNGRCLTDVIDRFTAVLLLHHDIDAEVRALEAALESPAFYIGALGSTRTHRRRIEWLRVAGYSQSQIASIKAPIGLFGPTRDATSLALSVLSDVAASRLAVYG